jgi:type IV pilus assembly protein PilY1
MRVPSKDRLDARRTSRSCRAAAHAVLGVLAAAAASLPAGDARAQGTVQRPMPNVMLLVDTSGSMERMADSTLPSDNAGGGSGGLPNACSPGVESNPNRWGMLIQALTGNLQPFYSCAAMSRSSGAAGAAFRNEYKINGLPPYDTDYALPYHRPLSGSALNTTTCALGPSRLPGAAPGTGVGPGGGGYSTGLGSDVRDFPDDALQSAKWTYMQTQYTAGTALGVLGSQACIFDQAPDGQLDAARDYVRFGLMTFDNDLSNAIGVNGGTWPPQGAIQTASPFLGEWSYLRDATNPDYSLGTLLNGGADGLPNNCAPPRQAFEVGARHYGAPPWEGRMVRFPAPDASLLDVQRVNEQIQRVLAATRPYGATPIDGMMDDARDYLWYADGGPKDDPYVATAKCRDQYLILLTDGAPNLDMRPACQGPTGICPYPSTAAEVAAALYTDTNRRVTTFVIGFSVNGSSSIGGDGFPTGYDAAPKNNCKAWYAGVGGTPTDMAAACTATPPGPGTAAEACCKLNEIAYAGTGGASAPSSNPAVGPYFAESQADIVLSFGRILASITKEVSTRTVPTYTPAVYSSAGFNSGAMTAQYLGSFIPNAAKPWSGEIFRERSVCSGGPPIQPQAQLPSITAGDSEAVNLATQGAASRLFITVMPDSYSSATGVMNPATNTVIDAARSVRPFVSTSNDGVGKYRAKEVFALDWDLRSTTDMRLAMQIDKTTCKRGRAASGLGTGTIEIPALDMDNGQDCTDVVWGFAAAHVGSISKSGHVPGGGTVAYDFNIRCPVTNGTPSSGKCSITGDTCDVANPTACAAVTGQVCVPDCAPLGAIFRANPVVNGPPDALLRDAGYRAFQARRLNRRPTLFAATTDGILHAFKAVETATNAHHELWSFVPPAVLPRLASNYPAGNQILLDGSPIVKDTVWDRGLGDLDAGGSTSPGAKWHTTLVAGLGANGGGYYAVNVTDSDCDAPATRTTGECATTQGSAGYQQPSAYSLDEAGAGDYDAIGTPAKRGPHFLWQLTDVEKDATDPAKVVRRTIDGTEMVGLFGRDTGTPAIATVQLKDNGGADRQVGVAILPGGIDGTPVPGGSCDRIVTSDDLAHDTSTGYRAKVRQWAEKCSTSASALSNANSAVPGRGVTIVRLDTGEIVRHFGRRDDVPAKIWSAGKVNATPFDSPMVGTPVVYPQTTGAIAQKIFIGDADGTLWRIDVTSTNPASWKATLFADLIPSTESADKSQPIQVTPILSLEPGGSLVINAATGDQESVIYRSGEKNYVWSILEKRPTSSAGPRAQTNWRETLNDGERVTGPMTVFDRTLYFASFAPNVPAATACENAGVARLWGLNYFVSDQGTPPAALPMWCGSLSSTGVCSSGSLTKSENVTGALAGYLIPGVTLRASQACSTVADLGDGTGTGFSTVTPSEFQLTYGVGKARSATSGFPPAATTAFSKRPLPRVAATVNAWALVID